MTYSSPELKQIFIRIS